MEKKQYYEVSTKAELLQRMKERKHYILITDELDADVRKLLKTTLSDEELMGIELGSAGTTGIVAEGIYQILNAFSKKPKIDRQLESAIRQYRFKLEKNQILLYHKQLDY